MSSIVWSGACHKPCSGSQPASICCGILSRPRSWSPGFTPSLAALGVSALMRVELLIQRPSDPERLNGCGLVVANPPYTLEDELTAILPELSRRLAAGGAGARHRLDWIEPTAPSAGRPSPGPKQRVRPRR